ncbi:SPOR domain-containing protein [Photobacterium minamisatsumaniensis]|uniref:SPOR domain-containing protein n=1 Tax=Photobacterium minamisatsumaniensis TaxID=2910233 RepID=UPI003D12C9BA
MHVASLDLDSQVQLLSRIQFLTRFSSNLIPVTGDEGAGKTWLAQRYLEAWANAEQQVLVLCHPSQADAQHRAIILQQLAPNAVFNEHDPLLQSIERILNQYPVNLSLVIDDAHLLSSVVIAELWALIQHAQAAPDWQVNVLLFSHTGRLDKYLASVAHGKGQLPLEVEIPPFTEQEVQTFVEQMFADEALDTQRRRLLREKAAQVAPRPGELVKLEQVEHMDMSSKASKKPSPWVVLTILSVVLIAMTVGWFSLSKPESELLATDGIDQAQLERALADAQEETLKLETEAITEDGSQSADSIVLDESDESLDDSKNLPPEVSIEGLTVGRNETSQRVVVPSEVVDAMISDQDIGGSGEQAVEAQSPAVQTNSMNVAEEDGSAQVNSASVLPENDQPLNTDAESDSDRLGTELKRVDQSHYALQLAAMKSLTAAKKFVAEHDIASLSNIYETRRNGVPWFIIITGDYPNVVAARKAETGLPKQLQALQPWVKSYRQIHTEIERVK